MILGGNTPEPAATSKTTGKLAAPVDINGVPFDGATPITIPIGTGTTTDDLTEGATNLYFTNARALAAAPAETTTTEGALVSGATEKTTPADADVVGISDSAAGGILKKLSWSNIKATLKTYFDALYCPIQTTGTFTPTANGFTIVNGTGGVTFSGSYTKIGRIVFVKISIAVTGTATIAAASGNYFSFSGLPASTGSGVSNTANGATAAFYGGGPLTSAYCYAGSWSAVNNAITINGWYVA